MREEKEKHFKKKPQLISLVIETSVSCCILTKGARVKFVGESKNKCERLKVLNDDCIKTVF